MSARNGKAGKKRQLRQSSQIDFALEDQLLSVLHAVADSRLVQAKDAVLVNSCKFQVGMTIPDLLIITGKQNDNPRVRVVRRLTLFDCTVLAELLNCGPSGRRSITTKLYAQPASLDRAIERLMRWGLVSRKTDGTLAARRGLFSRGIHVVSVEAKLRRWREALGQARQYRSFSNSAFVALPERLITANSKIRPACAAEGIGLFAVNPNGAKRLLRARRTNLLTADWIWLVSKTVGISNHKTFRSNLH